MDEQIFEITVHTILNEKLYGGDWECDYFHIWAGNFKTMIRAQSIQEALERAAAASTKNGIKWSSVDYDEEIEPRHYKCHTIRNEEYTDKLHELYG